MFSGGKASGQGYLGSSPLAFYWATIVSFIGQYGFNVQPNVLRKSCVLCVCVCVCGVRVHAYVLTITVGIVL